MAQKVTAAPRFNLSTAAGRAKAMYAFLVAKGLTAAQAAGVVGNSYVETGGSFDPAIPNPAEGAIGLAQWEGSRRTGPGGLDQWAAAHHSTETNFYTQLGFLWSEASRRGNIAGIKQTTDYTSAAHYWQANFEVSDPASLPQREAAAGTIYHAFAGQHLTLPPGFLGATGGAGTGSSGPAKWDPSQYGGAPYDPRTLPKRLGALRQKIIAWLDSVSHYTPKELAATRKLNDKQLAGLYTGVVVTRTGLSGVGGATNGGLNWLTKALEDFAKWIGPWFLEGGLILLGIIFVFAALVLAAHSQGASLPAGASDTEVAAG